jgi:predicted CoA-binding protein
MPHQNPTDDQLRKLLIEARTIAIVGASSSPDRPSHGIMKKMLAAGYRVIPVNPRESEVLGQKAYPSLRDIPEKVDIVDVFRRAEDTPPIADEAVAIGARALWLQSGIVNDETARRAAAGGVLAIMDMCIGVEHSLLQIPKRN